jgi:LysR family hydrogen peroxide-inducible transcriptional activator
LLERGHASVLLTPAGEKVVARAIDVLTEIDAMGEEVAAATDPLSNPVKLGAIPTIAPFLLPDALSKIRKDYPGLQLLIREDLSANLVSLLQQGELDLILVALPYPAGNCYTHHLFYDPFILVCQSDHRFAGSEHIRAQDLKSHDFLLLEQGHCLREHILEACSLNDRQISLTFEATSLHTIVPMIANGLGITLLPKMALDAGITSSVTGLSTTGFKDQNIRRGIGLIWRKNSPREKDYLLLAEYLTR